MCFLVYNRKEDKKNMSKKSSKLMEISEMFDKKNINFDELNNQGINDIITIAKKQEDTGV